MSDQSVELILSQLRRHDARIDAMTAGLGEVASHCATLIERTAHLATREDITSAIRLHTADCKASRAAGAGSPRVRLLKALAALLTIAGSAVAAWLGFSQ